MSWLLLEEAERRLEAEDAEEKGIAAAAAEMAPVASNCRRFLSTGLVASSGSTSPG